AFLFFCTLEVVPFIQISLGDIITGWHRAIKQDLATQGLYGAIVLRGGVYRMDQAANDDAAVVERCPIGAIGIELLGDGLQGAFYLEGALRMGAAFYREGFGDDAPLRHPVCRVLQSGGFLVERGALVIGQDEDTAPAL